MIRLRRVKPFLVIGVLWRLFASAETPDRELRTFFSQHMGLSDDQIEQITRGVPVVSMLPTKTPNEVFVVGQYS